MSASKLSNSFSSSELGRINSYREQRMLIRPVSNHVEGEHLGISARNDLENIQQCLKNTILKRKESFNPSNDQQLGSDPFQRVITQLDVETNHNGIQPNSHSPELQSPAETTRHKHFYKFTMLDSTLNIIEENPQPSVPIEVIEKTASGKQQYRQNRENVCGIKQLQGANINKNVIQRVKPPTAVVDTRASLTSSMTTVSNSSSIKVLPSKQQFGVKKQQPKVPKHECIRVSRKVEQLKEQISKMPFRRRTDMQSCLQQLIEMLREHQ